MPATSLRYNCVDCGRSYHTVKEIEWPVNWDTTTVLVRITATECSQCLHLTWDMAEDEKISAVVERLKEGDLTGFQPVGIVYRA
jgi:hypothetical protein